MEVEFKGVCHPKPKTLLMKITSRERPNILLETVRQYIDKASDTRNMVWLFTFDEDDYLIHESKYTDIVELVKGFKGIGKSNSKIEAINRDVNGFSKYLITPWDVLVNISDDQRPIIKGYDNIIRNSMPDNLDASLWFTDGQPRVNTQEIIGRLYYKRFNYIYHPDYKSLFCDNESTEVAKILGKQIKSNQQIVKHFHPAWATKADGCLPNDALYERNNKFWNKDEATFNRRKKINFGL